jgi:hypothetical protein
MTTRAIKIPRSQLHEVKTWLKEQGWSFHAPYARRQSIRVRKGSQQFVIHCDDRIHCWTHDRAGQLVLNAFKAERRRSEELDSPRNKPDHGPGRRVHDRPRVSVLPLQRNTQWTPFSITDQFEFIGIELPEKDKFYDHTQWWKLRDYTLAQVPSAE